MPELENWSLDPFFDLSELSQSFATRVKLWPLLGEEVPSIKEHQYSLPSILFLLSINFDFSNAPAFVLGGL